MILLAETKRARSLLVAARMIVGANPAKLDTLVAACDTVERPTIKPEQFANAENEFVRSTNSGHLLEAVEFGLSLANAYRIDRRFESALEMLQKCEALLNDSGFVERIRGYDTLRLQATLYNYRGLVHGLGGQQTLAEKLRGLSDLEEALSCAQLAGDVVGRAAILNSKGLILFQIAEQAESTLQLAEDVLDESFGLFARLQNPRRMFQPLRNQVMVHQLRSERSKGPDRNYWLERAKSRYETASKYLSQVEAGASPGQDRAEVELRAAQICLDSEQNQAAMRHINTAIDVAIQTSDTQRRIRILAERSRLGGDAATQSAIEGLQLIDKRIQETGHVLGNDAIQTKSLMLCAYNFAKLVPSKSNDAIEILSQLEGMVRQSQNKTLCDSIIRHRVDLQAAPSSMPNLDSSAPEDLTGSH
jgi:tetratricopeptide (TPR) repeat protein